MPQRCLPGHPTGPCLQLRGDPHRTASGGVCTSALGLGTGTPRLIGEQLLTYGQVRPESGH